MEQDGEPNKAAQLEIAIRDMTRPIDGQYPRPWMTASADPASSEVFTVGMNQRVGFETNKVGSHEHYLDALFNRGPESCRQLYERVAGKPSPTRLNTDKLVQKLAGEGMTNVIETNVVCFATPMSADLAAHAAGAEQGHWLFQRLVEIIRRKAMIVHGAGAARKLGRALDCQLPAPPSEPGSPVRALCGDVDVFVIPSLAPPGYNKWARWADNHLEKVARKVADRLAE